ncbi:MAG: tetratricopeptide repeat protein [Acidobacteria bacterium]|nr:tetratricopeptide repeat protein [Acidobacteriota bacterium]
MKKSIVIHLFLILFVFAASLQAGTKEELERLQYDVNALRDQLREYEKTLHENNTGISGLKSLIEQLNDQAAKSNALLENVLAALEGQTSRDRSEKEEILPEIQELSNKIDDMAMSISALARQVSDLKVQYASIHTAVSPDLSSADTLFNQAYYDLLEENYDLAISGFNAYLSQFPAGDKATAARYNIGEAYYYMNRFQPAIEAYTQVLDENPDSDKIASAIYKRGKSFLGNKDSGKAVEDFKAVIKSFPDSPEAALAKAELADLGVAR